MANEAGQATGPGATPPLATPKHPLAEATVAFVRERFAAEVVEVVEYRGETTIVVRPAAIAQVCQALRDAPALRYNVLADLTAVDWPERGARYDIVYQLLSLETRAVIRLKTCVGDDETPDPELPSVMAVWPGADWYEREIFDLFGVRFTGRPEVTRILMPTDWVGYPLRKDYPLSGFQLPDPHWGGQSLLDQPLSAGTGAQTLRTADGADEINEPVRHED